MGLKTNLWYVFKKIGENVNSTNGYLWVAEFGEVSFFPPIFPQYSVRLVWWLILRIRVTRLQRCTIGVARYLVKNYSGCFHEGVLDETGIWIRRLSKAACPPHRGWPCLISWKPEKNNKAGKRELLRNCPWAGTSVFSSLRTETWTELHPQLSWVPGLPTTDRGTSQPPELHEPIP